MKIILVLLNVIAFWVATEFIYINSDTFAMVVIWGLFSLALLFANSVIFGLYLAIKKLFA
jgi:hypothetical protein